MLKVCHAVSAHNFYSATVLVQKSSKVVSLPEILSSLSPTSLSERLTILRRDITTNFIEFALTQPLLITRERSTDPSPASIDHKLELSPAPPNSATLVSRLDNLSEILEFFNANLFDAIPSSQRAAFLKSFSKPLTSGILNHLLIPALPTSLSGLPKYLELLERAVKFESNDLTRILFGVVPGISSGTEVNPENEIRGWAQGIASHYQKKRRVDILDQARRMFTDVSSDWHETFQVEWVASVKPSLSANDSMLLESTATSKPSSSADHPPLAATNGTNAVSRDVEIEQVDDEGWGFDDNGEGAEGEALSHQEVKVPPGDRSSSFADPAEEVDGDAWGWNDEEDPEPTPVPGPDTPGESTRNGNADDGVGGDEPLWDAWDDSPPSPQAKKVVPKPAKRLEKFSSKGKQGNKPPALVTHPPEPQPISIPSTSIRANLNQPLGLDSSPSLASSWSSSISTPSQQFQSIPPTPASATARDEPPREFYSVSSGIQDIVELVESVILESSEFSRSTLLAAYLPAPTSSTTGGTPGSVILNTVPSILDLFRALYPMNLHLEFEIGGDFQRGAGKSASSDGISKKALQFSNDCSYLEEHIQELLPGLPLGPNKSSPAAPLDVWAADGGLRGKVEDAGKRVKVYGESWFARTIVRHPSIPYLPSVIPNTF